MRIDYQQGDHLRVGRLLLARARQVESGPIVDGGSTRLIRRDEERLVDVLGNARVAVDAYQHAIDFAPWDASPELVGTRHVNAPLFDLARSVHLAQESTVMDVFGSLVFHAPGSSRAVAVGWLGAHAPYPARWRPRYLLAHARWVLAGRPANVYLADTGELRRKSFGGGDSVDPCGTEVVFTLPPAVHDVGAALTVDRFGS